MTAKLLTDLARWYFAALQTASRKASLRPVQFGGVWRKGIFSHSSRNTISSFPDRGGKFRLALFTTAEDYFNRRGWFSNGYISDQYSSDGSRLARYKWKSIRYGRYLGREYLGRRNRYTPGKILTAKWMKCFRIWIWRSKGIVKAPLGVEHKMMVFVLERCDV